MKTLWLSPAIAAVLLSFSGCASHVDPIDDTGTSRDPITTRGQYRVTLDYVQANRTRSTGADYDWAALGVSVNGGAPSFTNCGLGSVTSGNALSTCETSDDPTTHGQLLSRTATFGPMDQVNVTLTLDDIDSRNQVSASSSSLGNWIKAGGDTAAGVGAAIAVVPGGQVVGAIVAVAGALTDVLCDLFCDNSPPPAPVSCAGTLALASTDTTILSYQGQDLFDLTANGPATFYYTFDGAQEGMVVPSACQQPSTFARVTFARTGQWTHGPQGAGCTTMPPTPGAKKRSGLATAWDDYGSTTIPVFASTGTGFAQSTFSTKDGGWATQTAWMSGDFDGDNHEDLMTAWNDGGLATLSMRRSNGASFTTAHWSIRTAGWMDSSKYVPGDYDGDGKTDVAVVWNDAGFATIAVYLSNGSSFAYPSQWAWRDGGFADDVTFMAGDFDGDGRSDLMSAWNDGGMATFAMRRSTGKGFSPGTSWSTRIGGWMDSTQYRSGDFDGDGKLDVAAAWNDAGFTSVAVYLGTGSALQYPQAWSTRVGGWADGAKWQAGDFDGDGRADLSAVWQDVTDNTMTVRRSLGRSFSTEQWAVRQGGWMNDSVWCAGTF